eukprot:gene9599-biopygen11009
MATSCGTAETRKHIHDVGILVKKEAAKSVIDCTKVSNILMTIRIMNEPRNLSIIQEYAPTADSDEEDIEQFYEDLEKLVKDKPKNDTLII